MSGKIYDKNIVNVKVYNKESGQVLIQFEVVFTQDWSEEARNEVSA